MNKLLILGIMFSTLTGANVFAANAHKNPMSKEDRQKMATVHEKMATCLRSDKMMKDCFEEMRTGCKDVVGEDGCGMMGSDMMGAGMMHHKKWKSEDKE